MCGITGFLTASATREAFIPQIRAVTAALHHRGPDAGDVGVDADAGIALGYRRLSILDLSPAGAQPMHLKCGRYVIVFNGEIDNFARSRTDLESKGALVDHADSYE